MLRPPGRRVAEPGRRLPCVATRFMVAAIIGSNVLGMDVGLLNDNVDPRTWWAWPVSRLMPVALHYCNAAPFFEDERNRGNRTAVVAERLRAGE